MFEDNTRIIKTALCGPPNVGKSTLINALVSQKIAIATHKPQTTRTSITGIITDGDTQIVIFDTPGIFQAKKSNKLENFIVKNASKTIAKTDLLLLLVDAYLIHKILEGTAELDERIQQYNDAVKVIFTSNTKPNILILANKFDTLQDESLVENITDEQIDLVYKVILKKEYNTGDKKIIPISGLNQFNVDNLIEILKSYARNGDWEFDPEQCTDVSERKLAEEITREQTYLLVHAEVPYSITIDTDNWEEKEDGSVAIYQSIIVLKPSQKNIVIGRGGNVIKKIGERARFAITGALDRPVHLFLHVKVRSDWIEKL